MNRALKLTSAAACVWALLVFGYGLVSFPDAPYKPCNSTTGYCGKNGAPHTEGDFRAERTWSGVLIVSWSLGIISAIYLSRSRRKTP